MLKKICIFLIVIISLIFSNNKVYDNKFNIDDSFSFLLGYHKANKNDSGLRFQFNFSRFGIYYNTVNWLYLESSNEYHYSFWDKRETLFSDTTYYNISTSYGLAIRLSKYLLLGVGLDFSNRKREVSTATMGSDYYYDSYIRTKIMYDSDSWLSYSYNNCKKIGLDLSAELILPFCDFYIIGIYTNYKTAFNQKYVGVLVGIGR